MNLLAVVSSKGNALTSWVPLYVLLGAFVGVLIFLFLWGKTGNTESGAAQFVLRIPDGLERLVHIPGWAAATIGMSLFGLLVAGQAFYNDVAWHVTLGRDKNLFTAPHTGIVIGLGLILMSGLVGVLLASMQRIDTALRWKSVRVPWSTLPLLALGGAAVTGFPLDELWHRAFGVDVTMWSPTHMLMILGAAFVGIAAWLVLADAGVKPHDSRWSMGIHVVAAWLTLQGLIAPLGEFSFGVPQFQQIFHPLILVIASTFAFVTIRLVLGRWWSIPIGLANFALATNDGLGGGDKAAIHTKVVGLFIASALAVELAAFIFGTQRRTRFAIAAGVGVSTLGLAGDFWWNHRVAYQPWNTNLLPDAVLLGLVAAIATGLLAVAFARAVGHEDGAAVPPRGVLAAAGIAVLLCLALPMPRHTGNVVADMKVGEQIGGYANIDVKLTPANAADNARWFQSAAWQGGGLDIANMKKVGPGHYVSDHRIPVSGGWKAMLRLHRGGELMAVPIFLPGDPQIHKPEIPAVNRTMAFQPETKYLLREQHSGNNLFKHGVYALLFGVMVLWIGAFTVAVAKIAPRTPRTPPTNTPVLRAKPVAA